MKRAGVGEDVAARKDLGSRTTMIFCHGGVTGFLESEEVRDEGEFRFQAGEIDLFAAMGQAGFRDGKERRSLTRFRISSRETQGVGDGVERRPPTLELRRSCTVERSAAEVKGWARKRTLACCFSRRSRESTMPLMARAWMAGVRLVAILVSA